MIADYGRFKKLKSDGAERSSPALSPGPALPGPARPCPARPVRDYPERLGLERLRLGPGPGGCGKLHREGERWDGRGSVVEGGSGGEGEWGSRKRRGGRTPPHLYCSLHEEELKLFCETDRKLICGICRDSREHKYHQYLPVNEALEIYKDKLKSSLESASRRKAAMLKAKFQQKQKMSEVQEQSHSLQSHIRFEFARMYRFLNEKEQQLSHDLRDMEGQILGEMEENLQRIQDTLDSIERLLGQLQTHINQQDVMALLKEESIWNRRFSDKHSSLEVVNLDLPLGIFKGPLQYTAWREMLEAISPAPAPLTLNPDTANPWLVLSEDLRSVKMGNQQQTLPELPARFDRCACVLGAEGFTTGRHYWEVKVGQKTEWDLGVARKSCERKGRIQRHPKDRYWRLSLRGQSEYRIFTEPPTSLSLAQSPRTVGVYLDYEGGQVSFYDADRMVHLYTFTDTFTERLYPYYCPCLSDGGRNSEALKICWLNSPTCRKVPGASTRPRLNSDTSSAVYLHYQ
ncbi:zinc-binding protein A33-like [Pristis pectinata]|uniref:zinc-binding protein A33-like n=1 Tax=Pristis pectinata TaxID=685728 RepID=UPI00223E71EA|nr:zinc-binding protein A33-like [Pristis pectinata]